MEVPVLSLFHNLQFAALSNIRIKFYITLQSNPQNSNHIICESKQIAISDSLAVIVMSRIRICSSHNIRVLYIVVLCTFNLL